jgi:transcriptional regulator with XRE-family HTH domain
VPVTVPVDQLGAALRRRRREERISLRAVETQVGISAATLSRIERDHRPDIEVIDKLAKWLGVNVCASGEDVSEIKTDEDLKHQIAIHLRATRKLPDEVTQAIVQGFDLIVAMEIQKAKQQGKGKPKGR